MRVSRRDFFALYYDLLYSHRDIRAEVDFLEEVFESYSLVKVKKVLDVGCGTGFHSIELAKRGYKVMGVDLSPEMVEIARSKAKDFPNVSFLQADATKLGFFEEFDAAIAMYGVISYFISDTELLSFLGSVRRALKPGAVFVFDTWNLIGVHGKRVYYETPFASFRKAGSMLAVKEEQWRVDFVEQVADAEIDWSIIDLAKGSVEVFSHKLKLRLFTLRELIHVLRETGFELCKAYEDYSKRPFTEESPEIVVIARASGAQTQA